MKVIVKKILPTWDMRKVHPLLVHPVVSKLEDNEVLVALNRNRTMVRLVTAHQEMFQLWARYYGETHIDLAVLQEAMKHRWQIDLQHTKAVKHRKKKAA